MTSSSFEVLQLNHLENSPGVGSLEMKRMDELCSSHWLWHLTKGRAEGHSLCVLSNDWSFTHAWWSVVGELGNRTKQELGNTESWTLGRELWHNPGNARKQKTGNGWEGREGYWGINRKQRWMDQKDLNLKWIFDKCRVEKRQKSKTKGIWLEMRKNWGKLSFRREDSSYELQQQR